MKSSIKYPCKCLKTSERQHLIELKVFTAIGNTIAASQMKLVIAYLRANSLQILQKKNQWSLDIAVWRQFESPSGIFNKMQRIS